MSVFANLQCNFNQMRNDRDRLKRKVRHLEERIKEYQACNGSYDLCKLYQREKERGLWA